MSKSIGHDGGMWVTVIVFSGMKMIRPLRKNPFILFCTFHSGTLTVHFGRYAVGKEWCLSLHVDVWYCNLEMKTRKKEEMTGNGQHR